MDQSAAASGLLATLWADVDVESLECCYCGSQIGSHDVLARTFRLSSQGSVQGRQSDRTRRFEVPALHDSVVIFDRHLDCLFRGTDYVAVSHVWQRDVADAQHKKQASSATSIDHIARTVSETPARICKGLTASLGTEFEVWHDYISVPQWREDVKKAILQAMHHIFERAMLTTVYCSDLDAATCHATWRGTSAYDRCHAISDVCNVKYFSRMWTAMEFTQSRKICFMTKDFTFLSENDPRDADDENLFTHITERWESETTAQESAQAAEEMVGMGYNLVPWQLGTLELVRREISKGLRTSFANAHALLFRRCVTIEHDFLYALLGTLKLDLTEPLDTDMSAALQQMARECLRNGDLSPLLMMPAFIQGPEDPLMLQSYGFHDVNSFGLGAQTRAPTYRDVKFDPANRNVIIKSERLGKVQHIRRVNWFRENKQAFALLVRLVLDIEGASVDGFLRTLGCRLFGQDVERMNARLSEEGRRDLLQSELEALSETWSHHETILRGSNTEFEIICGERPMLCVRDGADDSSGPTIFDLAECLGNHDGRFVRTMDGFHLAARAIKMDGTKLTAELRAEDGVWKRAEIDVRTVALYSPDEAEEHLNCIADVMGLSNRALGSETKSLSPMKFLGSHGATIHGGGRSAFVEVACAVCHRSFLVRTALFSDDEQISRSTAWRIPGLGYQYTTLEDGVGFLLCDGRVVGRFIWAAQTCDCPKLDEVEVLLHDPPVPRQNSYEYGKSHNNGWIPVQFRVDEIVEQRSAADEKDAQSRSGV